MLAEDLSQMDAYVHPWLQPVLGNPFFSVRELPTRCNWTSWFDNTQKRLDVVRDVRAQNPAPHAPCTVQRPCPALESTAAAWVLAVAWREHLMQHTVACTLVCT